METKDELIKEIETTLGRNDINQKDFVILESLKYILKHKAKGYVDSITSYAILLVCIVLLLLGVSMFLNEIGLVR